MNTLADELKAVIQGEVDTTDAELEKMSHDTSLFKVRPEVVVRPKDASDVEALVRFAAEKAHKGAKVSLTARAAGTDMSGGVLTDSVVIDTTTHLNRFLELGVDYAIAEPGMYFRDFDAKTKEKNLEMPGYPASRNLAALGGMVGNNAGGEKNLKLGKTARYVDELDVVLADGNVHTLKNLSGEALSAKLSEQSFEGDIYRAVSELLKKNRETIEKNKPVVEKNSSGYALWDIGDGVTSLNLARLMVGAQGTLGITTKIKFKLVKPKPYSSMVVIFLKGFVDSGPVIPQVLKHAPDSFESYDEYTFKLAAKYFPEFAAQMKAGIIRLGISFMPEVWMLLTGGIPKLVLLVEFRSETQEEALKKAEALARELEGLKTHAQVRVMKNARASEKYWTVRRESFALLRKKIRNMRTAPFIDDFVVPPLSMPEFLPKLTAILKEYDIIYTIAGHVGDGNYHVLPLIDPKRPDMRKIIEELSDRVYKLVLEFHGSISGEHNDGLIRTPYVERMFGPDMYKLFEEVKRIFDPAGIFNPGKKVGLSFEESHKHLDLVK